MLCWLELEAAAVSPSPDSLLSWLIWRCSSLRSPKAMAWMNGEMIWRYYIIHLFLFFSLLTHHHVNPNLYAVIVSMEHKSFLINLYADISIPQQFVVTRGCQATKKKSTKNVIKVINTTCVQYSMCILQYFCSLTALGHFELLLYGKELCEDYIRRQMCPLMDFVLSSAWWRMPE